MPLYFLGMGFDIANNNMKQEIEKVMCMPVDHIHKSYIFAALAIFYMREWGEFPKEVKRYLPNLEEMSKIGDMIGDEGIKLRVDYIFSHNNER